jgi:hypothetical protein
MENKKELIELFDEFSQASKELDKALDELNKQLIELLELRIKEMSKEAKEIAEDCFFNGEKIKSFEECTLGEKFILYLLEKNKIRVSENMIEDAEALIYNNPVLDFLIMHDKDILDNLNAFLNSLYEVNLEKLRVKKS